MQDVRNIQTEQEKKEETAKKIPVSGQIGIKGVNWSKSKIQLKLEHNFEDDCSAAQQHWTLHHYKAIYKNPR